jgi:hypothetical protein
MDPFIFIWATEEALPPKPSKPVYVAKKGQRSKRGKRKARAKT